MTAEAQIAFLNRRLENRPAAPAAKSAREMAHR